MQLPYKQEESSLQDSLDLSDRYFPMDQSSEKKSDKRKKIKKKYKKLKKAYKRKSAELQRLREQADSKKLFWKTLSNAAPKVLQICGDIYNAKHREKMLDKQMSFKMFNKKHKKNHKKNKSNLVT